MVNWSSFYILKLNIRKSLNVSYTYSHPPSPPPPNPSCHQLPTSQGNYEVHPGNKDNPQVRAKCKTIYCDLATYLLFLDFLWGHPNPCEVQQFKNFAHSSQISVWVYFKILKILTLNFQLGRFFTEKPWFAKALNFSDAKWLDQGSCHCKVQCNLIQWNKLLHGWKIGAVFWYS